MKQLTFYFSMLLITFSSCSEEFIADQVAGNYDAGFLSCVDSNVEDEFTNVEVTYDAGDITIDLGLDSGVISGEIADDGDLFMDPYVGMTASGVALDLPSSTGIFRIDETENGRFKTLTISFSTVEEARNICILTLTDFQ